MITLITPITNTTSSVIEIIMRDTTGSTTILHHDIIDLLLTRDANILEIDVTKVSSQRGQHGNKKNRE